MKKKKSYLLPINDDMPPFKFPEYKTIWFNNGVKLYLYSDNYQPLVFIKVIFNVGAYNEMHDGGALFTAQMMTRGTHKRSAPVIDNQIDRIGGNLNSTSFWDYTQISGSVLSRFTENMFDIIFDCCFNPAFKEKEIAILKSKYIANILQEYSDPDYLAQVAFNKLIYSNSPYSHPIIGTPESISKIKRDDCINFHSSIIKSAPAFIISGNIEEEKIARLVENYISDYKFEKEEAKKKYLKNSSGVKIGFIHKNGSVQSTIRIGKIAIDRNSRVFPHFQLLNTILGGYFHSRLNQILREDKGYTYGVHSSLHLRKHAAVQVVSAHIKDIALNETIETIISEMHNISSNGISFDEFKTAQRYVLGSFLRSIETPQQISSMIQTIDLFELPGNYWDEYFKTISSLNNNDLYKARYLFKPDNLTIAAAGDSNTIGKELNKFGNIIRFNEAGEVI